MKNKSTWHIHIQGQVQGVGFRPFVYHLAKKFQLTGWVNNTTDGVHIEFTADENVSKIFYKDLLLNAPSLSNIISHSLTEKSFVTYEDFKIISSANEGDPALLISPDFVICEQCSKEITAKRNRRYNYAFTTCTQCGPRYSIIKHLPYDRENTTMDVFTMCKKCNEEYNDPTNRRHFSQTNSCPDCPIVMKLYDNKQNIIEEDQLKMIGKICDLWSEGKIIAIKGIGGYLLTCDAANTKAIKDLRLRKHRPAKPFALMFPDMSSLEKEVYISNAAINELKSVAAPIVLLPLKENADSNLALSEIAPRLLKIGVMFTYTPLYQLLLQQFAKPIVATSGNISNAPIVFTDAVALNDLNAIADYILVNDREIIAPQDDSVITYSKHLQHRIILRRARGLAPLYINKNLLLPQTNILAMGALLKSSFTLLHQQNIHTSQYLGDTDNYDAQKNYNKILSQFLDLFHVEPQVILIDKHPGYYTSQAGEELSKKWNCELRKVQHHEAHFASVLGEHNLAEDIEPILGVMWDGTGYGIDGQIWGGEFFTYHQYTFSRVNHFEYFESFLGDKMAIEPRLSAFSLCNEIDGAASILQSKFTTIEWSNYKKIIANNTLKTSSVGRIFDAVGSLLGLPDKTSYEGEAALLLEETALNYFKYDLHIPDRWLQDIKQPLNTQSLMRKIVKKINEGEDRSEIAAWFHVQLILAIQNVAYGNHCKKICCSGGVFQNGLLVDLAIKILGEKYKLYFNNDLSPNDENISFGQLIWYLINEKTALKK